MLKILSKPLREAALSRANSVWNVATFVQVFVTLMTLSTRNTSVPRSAKRFYVIWDTSARFCATDHAQKNAK